MTPAGLDEVLEVARDAPGRFIVFIAGPPGAGKSTLARAWERAARDSDVVVQALSLDGFHLPSRVLDERRVTIDGETMPLRRVKGAPESYDVDAVAAAIDKLVSGESLRWPRYDRELHEPVADAIAVADAGVVVVEGNWLLLDEPGWCDLSPRADRTVFLECNEALARENTIGRHVRGGRDPDDAERHYRFSDLRNRERALRYRLASTCTLRRTSGGEVVPA